MIRDMTNLFKTFLVTAVLLGPLVLAQEQNHNQEQGSRISRRPNLGRNIHSSADNIALGIPKLDISNIIPVEDIDVHLAKTESEAKARRQQGSDIGVGKSTPIQLSGEKSNVVNDVTDIMFIGDRKRTTTLSPKPKLKFKNLMKTTKLKQKRKLWKQVRKRKMENKGRNKSMVRIINDILEHIEEHNNRSQGAKLSTSFIRDKLWSLVALRPKSKKTWRGNLQRISAKLPRNGMRLLKKKKKDKKEKDERQGTTKRAKESTINPSTFHQTLTTELQSKTTQTGSTRVVTKSPKTKKKNKVDKKMKTKKKNKKPKKKNKKVKKVKDNDTETQTPPSFTSSALDENQTHNSLMNASDKAETTSAQALSTTSGTTERDTPSTVVKQETTSEYTTVVTENSTLPKSTKRMKTTVSPAIKKKNKGKFGKPKNNKRITKKQLKNNKTLKKNKLKKQKTNKQKKGKRISKTVPS